MSDEGNSKKEMAVKGKGNSKMEMAVKGKEKIAINGKDMDQDTMKDEEKEESAKNCDNKGDKVSLESEKTTRKEFRVWKRYQNRQKHGIDLTKCPWFDEM